MIDVAFCAPLKLVQHSVLDVCQGAQDVTAILDIIEV